MIQMRSLVAQIQNLKRDQIDLSLTNDQILYRGEKLLAAWVKEALDIASAKAMSATPEEILSNMDKLL